jgi:hypothetical protein
MSPDEITVLYEQVKKSYFPKWDRDGRWTLKIISGHSERLDGAFGISMFRTREILINQNFAQAQDKEEVELLLIHEICHAVTNCGHKETFFKRFEKTAQSADEKGLHSFAELIRNEIESYKRNPVRGFCEEVYSQIEDWVVEDGEKDFDALIRGVAHDLSSSPDETLRRCTRCRQVYEKAMRKRKRHDAANGKLRRLFGI